MTDPGFVDCYSTYICEDLYGIGIYSERWDRCKYIQESVLEHILDTYYPD